MDPPEIRLPVFKPSGADEVLVDAGGTVNKNTFTFTPDETGEYYV